MHERVSKTHLENHSLSFAKLVSFRGRKGSAEAASLLPQASALLACAGLVASLRVWRWGNGKLLQSPEDLGRSLLVQADTDQLAGVIVQGPVASPYFLIDILSFLWKWGRACALPLGGARWVSARRVALLVRFLTLPV
jgi:hypothetical protein